MVSPRQLSLRFPFFYYNDFRSMECDNATHSNAGVWIVTFLPSSKVTPNSVTLHDTLLHASC